MSFKPHALGMNATRVCIRSNGVKGVFVVRVKRDLDAKETYERSAPTILSFTPERSSLGFNYTSTIISERAAVRDIPGKYDQVFGILHVLGRSHESRISLQGAEKQYCHGW